MSDTVKVKIASDAWVEGWGNWNANDKTLSIKLTRAQVEAAVKELNEPKFEAGDFVSLKGKPGKRYMVVTYRADDYSPFFIAYKGQVHVTDGVTTFRYFAADLIGLGQLNQEVYK